MSQVNKIDEAILVALCNAEVSAGTGLIGWNFKLPDDALDKAKQALLSAILEVKPKLPIKSRSGLNALLNAISLPKEEIAFDNGYQKALDEWEQAIKGLFG